MYYLLAHRGFLGGCATCKLQYSPVVLQFAMSFCVYGYYVFSFNNFATGSPYVKNCLEYSTTLTAGNYQCKVCIELFIPTLDSRSCVQAIANCAIAQSTPNTSLCQTCNAGFIRVAGSCAKPSIESCEKYEQTNYPSPQQCIKCVPGMYLKTGGLVCAKGQVANCKSFQDNAPTVCLACMAGYGLINVSATVTYCYPIPPDSNCSDISLQNVDRTNIGVFSCLQCTLSATKVYGVLPFP